MDEGLENTANEALRAIIDNATLAKEFIPAELPDVVQQLLHWEAVISGIHCAIGTCFLLIPVVLVCWQYKNRVKHMEWLENEPGWDTGFYFANLANVFPIVIGMIWWDFTWLKIWMAPKVYLLEYAASLVK